MLRQLRRMYHRWTQKLEIRCVEDRLVYSDPTQPDVLTLPLRGYRQVDFYSCGFVAGAMVVKTFYPHRSIEEFFRKVRPDEDVGTPVTKLVQALRDSGVGVSWRARKSRLTFEGIRRNILRGKPIIVTMYEGEDSHWAVIYGLSWGDRRDVYIAGNKFPGGQMFSRNRMRWEDFKAIWEPAGFGLVCSQKK